MAFSMAGHADLTALQVPNARVLLNRGYPLYCRFPDDASSPCYDSRIKVYRFLAEMVVSE